MPVEVECTFEASGHVRVRRVRWGDRWQAVEQGRQWRDADGRHVLVIAPESGANVRELLLRVDTLAWELLEPSPPRGVV